MVTDSGRQFTSDECQIFFRKLGIKHTFSAPKHPATNGAAEGLVKTFKRKVKAITESESVDIKTAIQIFLFSYRTTKHVTTNETPAKLLYNRELRTPLQLLRPDSRKLVENKQENQIRYFKGNRNDKFSIGNVVMAKDFRKDHPKMSQARIVRIISPRSCIVKFEDGGEHKRHFDQLIKWRESNVHDICKTSVKICKDKNKINVRKNVQSDIQSHVIRRSNRNKKPIERYDVNK